MRLNTESVFYVRKGCLHNISGEFHYKDLHPKFKKGKKKLWPKNWNGLFWCLVTRLTNYTCIPGLQSNSYN